MKLSELRKYHFENKNVICINGFYMWKHANCYILNWWQGERMDFKTIKELITFIKNFK